MSAEWPSVRLGDHVDSCLGKMLDKRKNKGVEQPYLGNSNVRWGEFDLSDLAQMRFEEHEQERYGIKPGDLIICEGGEPGRCAIWQGDLPDMRIQKALHRVRTKASLNNHYLYYWFLYAGKRGLLEPYFTGTTIKHLTGRALNNLEIPLPSIAHQKFMAEVLGSLDSKIQLNHQINQTLEQIAQAIFKSWFVDFEPVKAKIAAREAGGSEDDALLAAMQVISGHTLWDADAPTADAAEHLTRLQTEQPKHYATLRATAELFPSAMQESELGEIPEGWKTGPLSDLFELHRGYDLPKKIREDGQFLVYAAGGLHGTHSQYKMEPPGIITGRSGVIGNVYLSLKKYWPLNTTLYVRQFRESGPYYAYHLLGALDLKSLNSGSAVPSLNRNFVHSTIVLKPDSLVLDKFELFASSFFTTMAGNLSQNELLQDVRDTLLPKLLSGELSVADAETRLVEAEQAAHV